MLFCLHTATMTRVHSIKTETLNDFSDFYEHWSALNTNHLTMQTFSNQIPPGDLFIFTLIHSMIYLYVWYKAAMFVWRSWFTEKKIVSHVLILKSDNIKGILALQYWKKNIFCNYYYFLRLRKLKINEMLQWQSHVYSIRHFFVNYNRISFECNSWIESCSGILTIILPLHFNSTLLFFTLANAANSLEQFSSSDADIFLVINKPTSNYMLLMFLC